MPGNVLRSKYCGRCGERNRGDWLLSGCAGGEAFPGDRFSASACAAFLWQPLRPLRTASHA